MVGVVVFSTVRPSPECFLSLGGDAGRGISEGESYGFV